MTAPHVSKSVFKKAAVNAEQAVESALTAAAPVAVSTHVASIAGVCVQAAPLAAFITASQAPEVVNADTFEQAVASAETLVRADSAQVGATIV
jgi:hypothetical protein